MSLLANFSFALFTYITVVLGSPPISAGSHRQPPREMLQHGCPIPSYGRRNCLKEYPDIYIIQSYYTLQDNAISSQMANTRHKLLYRISQQRFCRWQHRGKGSHTVGLHFCLYSRLSYCPSGMLKKKTAGEYPSYSSRSFLFLFSYSPTVTTFRSSAIDVT